MKTKVLILGMDGYLGWSLAVHLAQKGGYAVSGIDDFRRRRWVEEVKSHSAIPIATINDRLLTLNRFHKTSTIFQTGNLQEYEFVDSVLARTKPDVVVHFAEMPSAPYSMRSNEHTLRTQWNNISTTINTLYAIKNNCPGAHLVKLGSMGEYGTPNVPIPEGFFTYRVGEKSDVLPFPKQAGSWYHLSKVHDSHNVMFACRIWNLCSTDIMQGVIYGTKVDGMDHPDIYTRFDFDGDFGTAINRFVAQALIQHPITPYGIGKQKRGFLSLRDSMQCLTLAIDNPPEKGEYRVFNQFEDTYTISELASMVYEAADDFDLSPVISSIKNPRVEYESHYYEPEHKKLLKLGYKPSHDMFSIIKEMITDLLPYKDRIKQKVDVLLPCVQWSGKLEKVEFMEEV